MNNQLLPGAVIICLCIFDASASPHSVDGRVGISGEVVAAGCSISLRDSHQVINFGDVSVNKILKGNHPQQDLIIRMDNCKHVDYLSGGVSNPGMRIRFNGIQSGNSELFELSGDVSGVALQVKDEKKEVIKPDTWLNSVYLNSSITQTMKYQLELVPDGHPYHNGYFFSVLGFNIHYE
ncbi:type 1 fimbrial protein [Salmonella enterica]|nr:type 1 fimbrial protein [Salmonella enterica]